MPSKHCQNKKDPIVLYSVSVLLFQVRKRQIMYKTFGDYRKKMSEDMKRVNSKSKQILYHF